MSEDGAMKFSSKWRLAWVLVPAAAFVGVLAVATFDHDTPAQGDDAPNFEAPLLDDSGSLEFSELRGKPVVLNFWASWCAPCKDEAPLLARAHEIYGEQITFVGVDIRDARSDALDFVDEYGLDYIHVRDERQDIYDDYGLTGQPETFFIDQNGVIVEHVPGPLFEEDLFALLDVLVRRDG